MIVQTSSHTVDDVCVKCRVSHFPESSTISYNNLDDAVEMTCTMRRWESSSFSPEHPLSPAQHLWGLGNSSKAEILLCPSHLESPVTFPGSAPGSFNRPTSFGSAASSTKHKISGSASDTDRSYCSEEKRPSLDARTAAMLQRRNRRRLQSDDIMPPIPPNSRQSSADKHLNQQGQPTSFPRIYSACGARELLGKTATVRDYLSYSISSEDILEVLLVVDGSINPPANQRIEFSTKIDGYFYLYFENSNSHDVVRLFLQSCVEPLRIQHRNDHHKAQVSKILLSGDPDLHSSASSKSTLAKGSFDMDKFQERTMKDHIKNESSFIRIRRKLSYMANNVGDCKSGRMLLALSLLDVLLFALPFVFFLALSLSGFSRLNLSDCCAFDNTCGLSSSTEVTDEFKTSRNLNGMVSMDESKILTAVSQSSLVEDPAVPQFSYEVTNCASEAHAGGNIIALDQLPINKNDDVPDASLATSSSSSCTSGRRYYPGSSRRHGQECCKAADL